MSIHNASWDIHLIAFRCIFIYSKVNAENKVKIHQNISIWSMSHNVYDFLCMFVRYLLYLPQSYYCLQLRYKKSFIFSSPWEWSKEFQFTKFLSQLFHEKNSQINSKILTSLSLPTCIIKTVSLIRYDTKPKYVLGSK